MTGIYRSFCLYVYEFPYYGIAYENALFGQRQVTVLFLEITQSNLFFGCACKVVDELFAESLFHPLERNAVGSAQACEYGVVVAFLFAQVLNLKNRLSIFNAFYILLYVGNVPLARGAVVGVCCSFVAYVAKKSKELFVFVPELYLNDSLFQ